MVVGIVVAFVALACAAGSLFYRRRRPPGGSTPPVQTTTKNVEIGAVEADLPVGLPSVEDSAAFVQENPLQKSSAMDAQRVLPHQKSALI
jgi:hypothetical protein